MTLPGKPADPGDSRAGNGGTGFVDPLKNAIFRAGDAARRKWMACPAEGRDLAALAIASILAVALSMLSGGLDAIGNWERRNGLSYLHVGETATLLMVLGIAVAIFRLRRDRDLEKALLFHQVETAKKEWERSLDSIEHMVVLSDLDGTIHRCNRAFKEFIGRTYAEILKENFVSLMSNFGIEGKDLDIRDLNARLNIMGKWFVVTSYPIEEPGTGNVAKAVILLQDATTAKGSAKVRFLWGRAGHSRHEEGHADRLTCSR